MANKHDTSTHRSAAKGSAQDLHNEPATLETMFTHPATGSSRREEEPRRKKEPRRKEEPRREPSQSAPGDAADDASTASLRPRPLHDPRGLILAAPRYPVPDAHGVVPFVPPFHYVPRKPWIHPQVSRSYRSPYKRLKPISAIYFVIFMAVFFLAALIVAMFMAIYFGHKY